MKFKLNQQELINTLYKVRLNNKKLNLMMVLS